MIYMGAICLLHRLTCSKSRTHAGSKIEKPICTLSYLTDCVRLAGFEPSGTFVEGIALNDRLLKKGNIVMKKFRYEEWLWISTE